MKVKYWILLLVSTNTGMLAFAFWYARHTVKRLAMNAQHIIMIPASVIEELNNSLEGVRKHLSSNHDETDGELRLIGTTLAHVASVIDKFMGRGA